jgi:hypothetical protein
VKIKGTCKRDGREFMVDQAIESGGSCPWDGEPFENDYAVVLVDSLRDAQEHAGLLLGALEKIASLQPDFTLQSGSLIGPIQAQLTKLEQKLITQG